MNKDVDINELLLHTGGWTRSQMCLLLDKSPPTVSRLFRAPGIEVIKVPGSIDRITRASGLRLLGLTEEDVVRLVATRRKVSKEVA